MKKHFFLKIDVYISTIIFILLSIIYDAFLSLVIFYSITLIHELGHFIMAKIFKVKCHKLNFHPLGFSLEMENIYFIDFYKQILILIAGPLTFFISSLLIKFAFSLNLFSLYQYNLANENNLSLFIFNLMPFYPLDGGRIFELCLFKFFPVKKAKLISLIINILISFYLIVLSIRTNQLLMVIFIINNLLFSIIFFKKEYEKYLCSRIGNVSKFENRLSDEKRIYHFYNNYFFIEGDLISEEEHFLMKKIKNL